MYFKLKSNVPKFSYILHKNPNSPPYESELSCGNVIGKFLDEQSYEVILNENNIKFLNTAKKLNLDVYLNKELTSICPYTLKSIYDIFRSVIRGTTNTPEEILSTNEFLQNGKHSVLIGPIVDNFEFVQEIFNSFDLNIEKHDLNENIQFETCFALNITNNTECSLTEFLQKIYILCIYISYDRKSLFNIDENTIEKIVFLSKNWLFNSIKFNMIINKFCKNNSKFKEKFFDILKENLEKDEEETVETFNKKLSLHEKRHNILINKLQQENIICNRLIDLCSSEGKLIEKLSTNFPKLNIIGFEKDFYKIKKFSSKENVKLIESNILYPRLSESDILPDMLTCVEAIEHFEEIDRNTILSMIRDVIVPNYIYLTTPNIEFNKFYNLPDGKLRRRDHCIEYTKEQFQKEIIDFFSSAYTIEFIDLIESSDEFENKQPSFCIFCTHKSITINDNLIEISKPFPIKEGESEPKIFTINVNKLEWTPERIEQWYNDTSDYRKPSSSVKRREVNYKKLKKIISMQNEIFLPISGYNVDLKELNMGYTSHNFIKNSNNIFYIAPTISPVESLYKSDKYNDNEYGSYYEYIEHPLSAFEYYKNRGQTSLISQTKYMGSRAQILWFESIEVAQKFGFNETVLVNSRGGFKFFDEKDTELYHSYIYNDILQNKEEIETYMDSKFNFIILDAEILPWSYKAKHLINEQFRSPIESYYLSNKLKNKETDYIEETLNTLNIFSKEHEIKIHPFHVLLYGNSNELTNIHHGYHMNNLVMMDIISAISHNSKIIKACEHKYIDLSSKISITKSIENWLIHCGKSPNETMKVDCNDNIIEGFVYKPINFESYLNSGYYLQPALKVRGYNYLNLTYGINLYQDSTYFNLIKNRRVNKKRVQAVQEFELSKYILNAFIHQKHETRLKYIAAFFGMEFHTSVDRTL